MFSMNYKLLAAALSIAAFFCVGSNPSSLSSTAEELSNAGNNSLAFSNSDYIDAFSTDLVPEIELNSDNATTTLTVTFDNSIAGLGGGSSINTSLRFSWETLSGGSKSLEIPIYVLVEE